MGASDQTQEGKSERLTCSVRSLVPDGLQEKLKGVKHVIFDEADTLLEGGFLRDIQRILAGES